MRKFFAFMVAAVFTVGMVGCGGAAPKADAKKEEPKKEEAKKEEPKKEEPKKDTK